MLLKQIHERTLGGVRCVSSGIHDETETSGLVPKLAVVIIPASRFAVRLLPGMKEFVQKSAEHRPKRSVIKVVAIQRHFTLETKPIVSVPEMP